MKMEDDLNFILKSKTNFLFLHFKKTIIFEDERRAHFHLNGRWPKQIATLTNSTGNLNQKNKQKYIDTTKKNKP